MTTVSQAVDRLNVALALDADALRRLFLYRELAHETLADLVWARGEGERRPVGFLNLLNWILGGDKRVVTADIVSACFDHGPQRGVPGKSVCPVEGCQMVLHLRAIERFRALRPDEPEPVVNPTDARLAALARRLLVEGFDGPLRRLKLDEGALAELVAELKRERAEDSPF